MFQASGKSLLMDFIQTKAWSAFLALSPRGLCHKTLAFCGPCWLLQNNMDVPPLWLRFQHCLNAWNQNPAVIFWAS